MAGFARLMLVGLLALAGCGLARADDPLKASDLIWKAPKG